MARLLVPNSWTDAHLGLDDYARGIKPGDADSVAQGVLGRLGHGRVSTLMVEDDLARRGDPLAVGKVAFVGDRVLRWASLADPQAAVSLLRSGSSGYPLNSYASKAAHEELGLNPGHSLTAAEEALVVDTTAFVVVSVYDAEAFLFLGGPDIEQGLA